MYKVLVVDDDEIIRESIKESLEYQRFQVVLASNGLEAVQLFSREEFDLVLMDVNMPKMDGIEALKEIKKQNPLAIVIILTAYSNVKDAVATVKEGAYNYLEKPITSENLVLLIKRALKARSMVETSAFSSPRLSISATGNDQFVGESSEIKRVFALIERLSKVTTPVLIRGESGTGKELVAKAIHYNGPRKDEKFVSINCAALPENLIESELFGHEKGAFTGANERKIGKFQYADGGTLFLDEVGDMSLTVQAKLLRVLQDKTFTPVGSNREISSDVRIIAASNKNFEEMIKEKNFREDLFYRLSVLPLYLPPLRKRKSDIPLLTNYYIDYFNNIHGLNIKGLSHGVEEFLVNYSWPGNIRELRNVIEHAFIVETSDLINLNSLPSNLLTEHDQVKLFSDKLIVESASIIDEQEIRNSVVSEDTATFLEQPQSIIENWDKKFFEATKLDFQTAKDLFEKEFISMALKENSGKINQTALKANIPKKTLLRKIEKYDLRPKDYHFFSNS